SLTSNLALTTGLSEPMASAMRSLLRSTATRILFSASRPTYQATPEYAAAAATIAPATMAGFFMDDPVQRSSAPANKEEKWFDSGCIQRKPSRGTPAGRYSKPT